MFDDLRQRAGGRPSTGPEHTGGSLPALREQTRPVSARRSQQVPVSPPLADLFPTGAFERGTTVGITAGPAGGRTTVALALVAAASAAGSWCVVVGLGDLGVVAAHEMGLDLRRVAMVPRPAGQWAAVVAALVEEVDVVLLHAPQRVAGHLARRLAARLRHRRAVLLVVGAERWPEPCEVTLRVADARWVMVGPGQDCLHHRLAAVTATPRRGDRRPRHAQLWLPGSADPANPGGTGATPVVQRTSPDDTGTAAVVDRAGEGPWNGSC